MNDRGAELVSRIRTFVGDSLRAVAAYDRESLDVFYLRDDIATKFDDQELDALHEEFILEGLGESYLERLFKAGDLRCAVFRFEEATLLHHTFTTHSGFVVSVDGGTDPAIDAITDAGEEWWADR